MKKLSPIVFFIVLMLSSMGIAQEGTCDDFTDTDAYPIAMFGEETIIGYTQEGLHPITTGTGATGDFQGADPFSPGIYIIIGPAEFDFDGSEQTVRFKMYGSFEDGEETFSVNDSPLHALNETFPMVVDGITVDRDDSPEDFGPWDYIYLTLSGDIESITFNGVEFGITELCVTPIFEDSDCDDFTDIGLFPTATFGSDELIGYSQGGTQEINTTTGGCYVNETVPGLYGIDPINFSFDGSHQTARFLVYGFDYQFDEMGFSVNGSSVIYLDSTFPMVAEGVEIDLDLSPTDVDDWEYFYLTFTGEIDLIQHVLFESGITELCVQPVVSGCNDFTNTDDYPSIFYTPDDIVYGDAIGTTQGGLYDINLVERPGYGDAYCYINSFDSYGGIFAWALGVEFEFSGADQVARFEIYYADGAEEYTAYSVNGEPVFHLDDSFPMTVDGVVVDLEISPDPVYGDLNLAYITFDGIITNITHYMLETGIHELCINPLPADEGCDDFTNEISYPEEYIEDEMLIGTTQGGTQSINTVGDPSIWINGTEPGIYGNGLVDFTFDGSEQSATFLTYGQLEQFEFMGFAINGSPLVYLDETFPMTVSGVNIDLDLSPPNEGSTEYFYLIFSGEIDVISHFLFESGLTQLCVGEPIPMEVAVPCDDLTNSPWPMDEIFEPGEVVGYTKGGSFPVSVDGEGSAHVNTDLTYFPGIFANNAALVFDFDGDDQYIQMEIYEWFGAGSEGFSINGGSRISFDESYPMTIDGVEVNLELTGTHIGSAEIAYLTFEGEVDEVILSGGEFGVTQLCYDADSSGTLDLGLEEHHAQVVEIYPNPAGDFVVIDSESPIKDLRIYTTSGQLVLTFNEVNKDHLTLNLTDIEKGFYLVEMSLSDGSRAIEKLLIR